MKQISLYCLCVLLLFSCLGCNQRNAPDPDSVTFYYPKSQLSFEAGSTAIDSEQRHMEQWDSWAQVLDIYLAGPDSEQFRSPFPTGVKIVKTTMENGTVYINVSQELAQLTSLELTIACSCLTLTCLELTGAQTVIISADGALLDGQKSITMDKNTVLLLDTAQGE